MSVNELFVKRVPVFADEDVVNNHFGLVLKEVIQRLGLGRFHWSLFPQKKSRCLISTQPGDVDTDTIGLLAFEEEEVAFIMARQTVKVKFPSRNGLNKMEKKK